jgi:hypothetical protein
MFGGRHLPFSLEAFLSLFGQYNLDIWPAQIVGYALGIAALFLVFRPRAGSDRAVAAILALFWLWNGVAYHWLYFTPINFAAPLFALIFVIQGLLLAWKAALRGAIAFRFRPGARAWAGLALALYAMLSYPLTNIAAGHGWPEMPVFAIAPCPTVIFTFGLLLFCDPRPPWSFLIIPLLWALVGGAAAWLLHMPEDLALPVAALAVLVLRVAPVARTGAQ